MYILSYPASMRVLQMEELCKDGSTEVGEAFVVASRLFFVSLFAVCLFVFADEDFPPQLFTFCDHLLLSYVVKLKLTAYVPTNTVVVNKIMVLD